MNRLGFSKQCKVSAFGSSSSVVPVCGVSCLFCLLLRDASSVEDFTVHCYFTLADAIVGAAKLTLSKALSVRSAFNEQ